MIQLTDILPSPSTFLENLFKEIQELSIDISRFECDHICYRIETIERYIELKKEFEKIGEFLSEEIVANRPISTFKLFEPIVYKYKIISCIELPAPKKGSFYKEGWEHIEFVIDTSFDEFMVKYSNLRFNTSSVDKKINPEISLKLENGSIKFHHFTLEYVVKVLQS